jgi:hypothetical protein
MLEGKGTKLTRQRNRDRSRRCSSGKIREGTTLASPTEEQIGRKLSLSMKQPGKKEQASDLPAVENEELERNNDTLAQTEGGGQHQALHRNRVMFQLS